MHKCQQRLHKLVNVLEIIWYSFGVWRGPYLSDAKCVRCYLELLWEEVPTIIPDKISLVGLFPETDRQTDTHFPSSFFNLLEPEFYI